jgi:hypothetical protein
MTVTHPLEYPMGQPAGPRHRAEQTFDPGPAPGAGPVDPAAAWAAQWGREAQARAAEHERRQQQWQAELQALWLRGAVVSRLELFNLRHAEHAWQLRNRFGVAATAVVLLYVDPIPQWSVKVAGMLFADTEAVADPARLLYEVGQTAREVVAAGGDPRGELCENPDAMSGSATYHGVAVSMLDTPAGSWRQVQSRVLGGGPFIPGRMLGWLTDGTLLLADRYPHDHPEQCVVAASQRLPAGWGSLGRIWRYAPELADLTDPATRPLWLRLHELHSLLAQGVRNGQ